MPIRYINFTFDSFPGNFCFRFRSMTGSQARPLIIRGQTTNYVLIIAYRGIPGLSKLETGQNLVGLQSVHNTIKSKKNDKTWTKMDLQLPRNSDVCFPIRSLISVERSFIYWNHKLFSELSYLYAFWDSQGSLFFWAFSWFGHSSFQYYSWTNACVIEVPSLQ